MIKSNKIFSKLQQPAIFLKNVKLHITPDNHAKTSDRTHFHHTQYVHCPLSSDQFKSLIFYVLFQLKSESLSKSMKINQLTTIWHGL